MSHRAGTGSTERRRTVSGQNPGKPGYRQGFQEAAQAAQGSRVGKGQGIDKIRPRIGREEARDGIRMRESGSGSYLSCFRLVSGLIGSQINWALIDYQPFSGLPG